MIEKQIKEVALFLIKQGVTPVEKQPEKDSLERESSYIVREKEIYFCEEDEFNYMNYKLEKKINYAIASTLRFNSLPNWLRELDSMALPDKKEIKMNMPENSKAYYQEDKYYFDEFISAKELINKEFDRTNSKSIKFDNIILSVKPIVLSNQTIEESLSGNLITHTAYWISWIITDFEINLEDYNDYIIKRLKDYYEYLMKKINEENKKNYIEVKK